MNFSFKGSGKLASSLVVSIILIALIVTVATANILDKKNVTVIDGEKVYNISTSASTVSAVLSEVGVNLKDEDTVEPGLDTYINEGTKISISRSFAVQIVADGKTTTVQTAPATVQEILKKASVTISDQDKINMSLDTQVAQASKIVINLITYKQVVENVTVEPKLVRKSDSNLAKGITKVLAKGQAGEEAVTYQVIYKDGKEVMRTQISSETIKKVQDKVVAYGTISVASRGGHTFSFTDVFIARSTAYTHTGRNTSSGTKPKVGTVAVDPSVIPLGTKLYIEGYGFATALDTGSAINGAEVDVFLDSKSSCRSWGVRNVRVYILK